MENKIIGDGPDQVRINEVNRAFRQSTSYSFLLENWKSFARGLGVDDTQILTLERKVVLGATQEEVLYDVLRIWKAAQGSNATLQELHDVLVDCKLKDVAETLKDRFCQVPVRDKEAELREPVADNEAKLREPVSAPQMQSFLSISDIAQLNKMEERCFKIFPSKSIGESLNQETLLERPITNIRETIRMFENLTPTSTISKLLGKITDSNPNSKSSSTESSEDSGEVKLGNGQNFTHIDKAEIETSLNFLEHPIKRDTDSVIFKHEGKVITLEEVYDWKLDWIPESNPLHVALYKGIYPIVKYLTDQYDREEIINFKYILHAFVRDSASNSEAVIEEKISKMNLLTELNPIWLKEELDQRTPLLQENVHFGLLQRLVQLGANINAHCKSHGTILHFHQREKRDITSYKSILRWATQNKFMLINYRNSEGYTPLLQTMVHFDEVDVELLDLFHKAGADFNAQDVDGYSVLFYTLQLKNCTTLLEKIISYGADVNHLTTNTKFNAAHILVGLSVLKETSSLEIIQRLKFLVSKAFRLIDSPNKFGYTALLNAMEITDLHEELLDLFHSNGTNFNAVSRSGNSVLFSAIIHNQSVPIIQKILACGSDLLYCNQHNQNALFMAAKHANFSALKFLCSHIDVNSIDKHGRSPLHWLFSLDGKNYRDSFKLLLNEGGDLNLKNKFGHTPFIQWIISNKNSLPAVVELKNDMHFTRNTASTTITYLVTDESFLQYHLLDSPTEEKRNTFTQFMSLLIDKGGQVLMRNGEAFAWSLFNDEMWKQFDHTVSSNFVQKLHKRRSTTSSALINLPVVSDMNIKDLINRIFIQIEIVLITLLECFDFELFMKLCSAVSTVI